ncbi:MAG: fluoride efflux transporter CrcB [Planctomycetota bacterium]|jgi:CrcB protein
MLALYQAANERSRGADDWYHARVPSPGTPGAGMTKILLIAGAGAIGALLRYGIAGLVQRWTNGPLPYGTLVVNVLGCVLIGVIGSVLAGPYLVRPEWRAAILIGLLGSFTTFSTFGWETFELSRDGAFGWAILNIVLSNGLGLAGVWAGYRLTEHWIGA